jgi:hypothetical protein
MGVGCGVCDCLKTFELISNEENIIFYKLTRVGGKLGGLYITINRATAIPTASSTISQTSH